MTTETRIRPAVATAMAATSGWPMHRRELTPDEDAALWDRINEELDRERRLRPPRGYNARGVWRH